jgi:hypothetical protein
MTEIVTLISQGGLIPFLVIVLYMGVKKHWVFGWYARELEEDRNEWKQAAQEGTFVARRAIDTAESVLADKGGRG